MKTLRPLFTHHAPFKLITLLTNAGSSGEGRQYGSVCVSPALFRVEAAISGFVYILAGSPVKWDEP